MSTYLLVCMAVVGLGIAILWFLRPRPCKECGGTGKIVCHDGTDHYYSACFKCQGTGWKQ